MLRVRIRPRGGTRTRIPLTNEYMQAGERNLLSEQWEKDEQRRLHNLGNNGPRDVEGHVMTHCVSNEHVAMADEPVTAS